MSEFQNSGALPDFLDRGDPIVALTEVCVCTHSINLPFFIYMNYQHYSVLHTFLNVIILAKPLSKVTSNKHI